MKGKPGETPKFLTGFARERGKAEPTGNGESLGAETGSKSSLNKMPVFQVEFSGGRHLVDFLTKKWSELGSRGSEENCDIS